MVPAGWRCSLPVCGGGESAIATGQAHLQTTSFAPQPCDLSLQPLPAFGVRCGSHLAINQLSLKGLQARPCFALTLPKRIPLLLHLLNLLLNPPPLVQSPLKSCLLCGHQLLQAIGLRLQDTHAFLHVLLLPLGCGGASSGLRFLTNIGFSIVVYRGQQLIHAIVPLGKLLLSLLCGLGPIRRHTANLVDACAGMLGICIDALQLGLQSHDGCVYSLHLTERLINFSLQLQLLG